MNYLLPPSAKDVLKRLLDEDRAIITATKAQIAHVQVLREREQELLAQREYLEEYDRRGFMVKEVRTPNPNQASGQNDMIIEHVRTDDLEWIDAELAELRENIADEKGIEKPTRLSGMALQRFVGRNRRRKFVPMPRPKLKKESGETSVDMALRYRERMLALIEERKKVENAAVSVDDVKAKMQAAVRDLARRGQPLTLGMFKGGDLEWPTQSVAGPVLSSLIGDGLSLVCYLFPEKIEARLNALIDLNAKAFTDALSADERARRIVSIDDEISKVEAMECAAVEAAAKDYFTIYHRASANPLAVLGVQFS